MNLRGVAAVVARRLIVAPLSLALLLVAFAAYARAQAAPTIDDLATAVSSKQWTLVFGRVDSLSLVFAVIMSGMCCIGTLYGLHFEEDAQHIAAWT